MKNSPKAMEEDRALKEVWDYVDNGKPLSNIWKKRFPLWFWGKIPFTNMGWEMICFHKLRRFKDGISFFEFNINLDLYDPLEYAKFKYFPHLNLHLVVLNYTLIELDLYKKTKQDTHEINLLAKTYEYEVKKG